MKLFARINLSSAALRRGILVSSLALAGKNGSVATKNAADPLDIIISVLGRKRALAFFGGIEYTISQTKERNNQQ